MNEEEVPVLEEEQPPDTRADWIILGTRWVLALLLVVVFGLNLLNPAGRQTSLLLMAVYLGFTLLHALFLWRRWGLRVWTHIAFALDIALLLALLFLDQGANSVLLPLLLLPVAGISMRLGFSAGLGLNLAALAGYALLVMHAYLTGTAPDGRQMAIRAGVFAGLIALIAVFGGLLAEQLNRPVQELQRRFDAQIQKLRAQSAAANNRAHAFYEMASTLSVTMSYQKVIENILQVCHRLLDFSIGVVLLSAGEEDLQVAASAGLRVGDTAKRIHLVAGGALSKSLTTANPALLEHLGRDPEISQIVALQRCRSGMCVPLRAGLRNYGVIVVGSINEGAYTPAHLSQLAALAHFATIAIQNAQLYQDLREERDKIIRAEENVRKELSRDLHDGPAQSLAAMAMSAEFIKRLLNEDPAKALEELDNLEKLARKTSWDVRTMLFELRPIILETQGLVPTLEQYVQRFPASEGLQVHLDTGGFNRRLDPKVETTVFMIMQEAVNNARKHAQARNLWLRLQVKDNHLIASVQDDGVGFDPVAVQASYERRGSFGLLNMKERAQLIGGHTEIHSAPGKGSMVVISVPLERY